MGSWLGRTLFLYLVTGFFIAGACLLIAPEAQAHGFGVHIAEGKGENSHNQFGLSWDTAVAEDRLFNYRMNLGFENFKLKNHFGETDKYSGWILENTFGFRLMADDKLRLWAGPQIVTGLYDTGGSDDLALGFGFSLGANWHLADRSSFAMTIGGRRNEYSGIWGYSEYETVGYLRLDFFFRTGRDRYGRP